MKTQKYPTKYGFDLAANPRSYFGKFLERSWCWEEPESELISRIVAEGDVCVDGGCHVGYFSALMSIACGATVFAFEPNPEAREVAVENLRGSNVHLFDYALNDKSGPGTLYLGSEFDDGWTSMASADHGDRSRALTIQCIRADEILPPGKIRLVKLDVEGNEAPALRGFGERLGDVDYFLIECQDVAERHKHIQSSVAEINEIFAEWSTWHFDGEWKVALSAFSGPGKNFLFVNPYVKVKEAIEGIGARR